MNGKINLIIVGDCGRDKRGIGKKIIYFPRRSILVLAFELQNSPSTPTATYVLIEIIFLEMIPRAKSVA